MRATSFKLIQAEQAVGLPQRIESEALYIHENRIAAIKRLGKNWLFHPAYVPNQRHSNNPEVYRAARRPFLAEIARRAAADRERRRAFQNAEKIRAAIGEAT
jgi:hypothetical protein